MPDASNSTFPIPEEPDEKPAEEPGPDRLDIEHVLRFEHEVAERYKEQHFFTDDQLTRRPGLMQLEDAGPEAPNRRDVAGIIEHGLNPYPWPDDPKPEPEGPVASEAALTNIARAFRR